MEEDSIPQDSLYLWAYYVSIINHGKEPIQVISRRWRTSDGEGKSLEFKGHGLIGERPVIDPGEGYEYHSFTQLNTPEGLMGGAFEIQTEEKGVFEISGPVFPLGLD